jgi:hypothetical protein
LSFFTAGQDTKFTPADYAVSDGLVATQYEINSPPTEAKNFDTLTNMICTFPILNYLDRNRSSDKTPSSFELNPILSGKHHD